MRGIVRTSVLLGALGAALLAPSAVAAQADTAKAAAEWRYHTFSTSFLCNTSLAIYRGAGYQTDPPPPESCDHVVTQHVNYWVFWHLQP